MILMVDHDLGYDLITGFGTQHHFVCDALKNISTPNV